MAALAPIAIGANVAGGALGTLSQAQALDMQAKAANIEADSVIKQAAFEEAQQRRKNALLQGSANAIGAASGVSISSGSPLFMELDRIKQGEIEALNIRRTGEVAAQGLRYQGRLARRAIPGSILQGLLSTTGTSAAMGFKSGILPGSGYGAAQS
jgi:hypothetical protein